MGILEVSHRGKHYDQIVAEVDKDLREIGGIPANYKVLLMTGGATGQNWIVPANLLPSGGAADYLVTGYWSEGSLKDAQQYCRCHNPGATIHTAASSADKKHSYIPGDGQIRYSANPAYVHIDRKSVV